MLKQFKLDKIKDYVEKPNELDKWKIGARISAYGSARASAVAFGQNSARSSTNRDGEQQALSLELDSKI